MRDKLNTRENYETLIEETSAFIKRDVEEFSEDWTEDRIISHFSRTFMYSYQVLISKYSVGLEVSQLLNDYEKSISFMEKGWEAESGYVEMVWMLSIGIMLEVNDENFNKLAELVKRDKLDDFLVNFLIKIRKSDWDFNSKTFRFTKPYKAIEEVIELSFSNKEEAVKRLKKYLQKEWYSGHRDTGWHNDHKSKWGVHFGYWSFESGALVKILGLDDTSLKDVSYYPFDMVHYKNPINI